MGRCGKSPRIMEHSSPHGFFYMNFLGYILTYLGSLKNCSTPQQSQSAEQTRGTNAITRQNYKSMAQQCSGKNPEIGAMGNWFQSHSVEEKKSYMHFLPLTNYTSLAKKNNVIHQISKGLLIWSDICQLHYNSRQAIHHSCGLFIR